jgi:transposase-like protein
MASGVVPGDGVERCGRACTSGGLCEELGVSRIQLRKWRKQFAARHEAEPATVQRAGETLEQENRG